MHHPAHGGGPRIDSGARAGGAGAIAPRPRVPAPTA